MDYYRRQEEKEVEARAEPRRFLSAVTFSTAVVHSECGETKKFLPFSSLPSREKNNIQGVS